MKKYLLSLITLALLMCEASFTGGGMVFAANAIGDSFTYNYTDANNVVIYSLTYTITKAYISSTDYGKVKVKMTGAPTSSRSITIPQTPTWNYSGTKYYDVTEIEKEGFKDATYLTGVTIPSTVTTIGYHAFNNCTSLSSITIPENVTKVGDGLFMGCSSLTSVTWNAINCTTCLKSTGEEIALSTSWNPFYCSSGAPRSTISSFTFGSNVEVIPNGLCSSMNKSSFTSITIPSKVTSVGTDVFKGCSNLRSVTWNAKNCADFASSSSSPFYAIRTQITSFSISSSIEHIPAYLCYGITGITGTKYFYSSLESIGSDAFNGCTGLTGLSFSSATNLETIGANAFNNCNQVTSITLPASLTTLGDNAFMDCSSLTALTLPTNITTIGNSAFNGCSAMTKLDMSMAHKLTSIGINAFEGCSNVDGLIYVPASVTSIGNGAFKDFSKIDTIVASRNLPPSAISGTFTNMVKSIPLIVPDDDAITAYGEATGWEDFTNIKTHTFSGQCGDDLYWSMNPASGEMYITGSGEMWNYNSSNNKAPWYSYRAIIKSVSISKDAESIGEYAFKDCSSVTSFTFNYDAETNHNSLVSIGQYAFQNCSSASFVNLWGSWSANLTTVNHHAFYNCALITSVTVPENVTYMGDEMFHSCPSLTTVIWNATNYTGNNFGQSVNPFYKNRSTITSFTFGSNVETIPAWLCYNMPNLTGTLTIGNNILSIGENAFRACSGYTALAFEAGCQLTSIPNYAFYQCTNLTLSSAAFPSTITSIGNNAFYECTHITSVNFGTSSYVTSIGEYAFKGCTGITSITLGTYSRLTSIGSYAFNGCTNISETNITLPPNLTTLGISAFDGCAKLKGTLTIKCPSLTAIGNFAFRDCGFTKLDLTGASSLTTIGNSAFSGCSSIAGEIYIPSTVTSIGEKAFYGCSAVTSMYVEPTSIPDATTGTDTGTFQGMTNTIPVRVPGSMVSNYQSAPGWEYFSAIQAYAAGQCGENLYWRINYDKRRLEITGSGAMYDYNNTTNLAPWRSYTSYWTTISFPETMTTFGKYAFYNCTNLSCSLSFLAGLEQIRAYAFYGCTGIYGLTFSSATSLTTIDSYAFYGCSHSSLTSLTTLPNSLTTIGGSAFGLCTSLKTVTIPKNVTTMTCSSSENTFYSCANITTVNWNAVACSDFTSTGGQYGVSYHTPWGLSKSHITQFNIASDVRIIPKYLCKDLTSITSISLGDSIREIHEGAFMDCSSLTDVTLPTNITTLGNSAFNGCSAMTKLDMSIANKLTSIGINAFEGCSNVDGLIYVPASVTSIDNGAFKDFSKVDTIVASRDLPPSAVSGTFTNMVKSIPLIVSDADAITAYGGATGWEEFTNIKTHTFSGQCGDNLYWSLNPASGEMDITGSGPMYDFAMEGSSWYAHREFIKRVNVEDGATYIGNNAFRNCKSMQYISLPASITSMGSGIFGTGTGQLKDYSYAGTLEQWLAIDFNGHSGNPTYATRGRPNIEGSYITDVVIPNGYTTVKPYVFTYCKGLKTLSLPRTLTELQSGCFYYCDSLTDIYCYAETPPTLPATNAGVFSTNLIKTATLHVLCDDAVDAYRAYSYYSDHWGRFTTIVAMSEWCDGLALNENADNASLIYAYDGQEMTVHLTRSLISASYNTICLPFDMTASQVETYFGANCDIEELTRASYADGNLKLFFTKRTAIEAGKPYLIQPQADVANPTIADVTIDNMARPSVFAEGVTFHGIFSPTDLADSESILFLGASNTLYMSNGAHAMKGMRGYFELTTPQAKAAAKRSARIILHEEGATGIESQMVNGKCENGKFIKDGQLFILRDGKTYNAQGALIK